METTRAAFLTRGAKGGLALVAGGALLGLAEDAALAAPSKDSDIAKLAATAELLAIDFYKRAIASKKFSGDELGYMRAALGNEQAHYKALAGVLGMQAPKNVKFKYPNGVVLLRQGDRQARTGARDSVRRRLHGRGHRTQVERAEKRCRPDRGERVAPPERADQHRRRRDRAGTGAAQGAHGRAGNLRRQALPRLSPSLNPRGGPLPPLGLI